MATNRLQPDQSAKKVSLPKANYARKSETEYDKTLQPNEVDLSDIKICKTNSNKPSRTSSDSSDDVIILADSTSSTNMARRGGRTNNYRYSTSSLPPQPSTKTFNIDSAHTHNFSPHYKSKPVAYGHVSSTSDPISDTEGFGETSRSYLNAVSRNTRSSNLLNKAPVYNDGSPEVDRNDDDDDDFEVSNKRSKVKPNNKNNSQSFYGNNKGDTKPSLSERCNTAHFPPKKYPSLKSSSGKGTVNDPLLLSDTTKIKPSKKEKKLHLNNKSPSLSSKDEFEVVVLDVESLKLGQNRSYQSRKFKFGNEDIRIVFEKYSNGESIETFIPYQDIFCADVFLNKEPPFLIAITVKQNYHSRLNSFLSTIHKDEFIPFRFNDSPSDKMIIATFKTGLQTDIITQELIQTLKKKPPHKIKRSAQDYINLLETQPKPAPSSSSSLLPPPLTLITSSSTDSDPVLHTRKLRRGPLLPTPSNSLSTALEENVLKQKKLSDPFDNEPIDIPDTSSPYQDDENILTYDFQNTKCNFVIRGQDMNSLEDACYLNDQIINFYLRYYWERLSDSKRDSVYVFSTFFYSRLVSPSRDGKDNSLDPKDKMHSRVKSWTKCVNIFEKKFVVVPVCYRSHWFVAILCNIADYTEPHPLVVCKSSITTRKRKTTGKKLKRKKKKTATIDKNQTVLEIIQDNQDEGNSSTADNCITLDNDLEGEQTSATTKVDPPDPDQCESLSITSSISSSPSVEKMEVDQTEVNAAEGTHNGPGNEEKSGRGIDEGDKSGHDINEEAVKCDINVDESGRGSNENGCGLEDDKMETDSNPVLVVVDPYQVECDASVTCIMESSPEEGIVDQSIDDDEVMVNEEEDSTIVVDGSSHDDTSFTEDTEIKSCLLVLDSMLVRRKAVGNHLTKYLSVEYNRRYPKTKKDFTHLPTKWPKVPPQTNGYDCGVFMLTYIENFFKHIEHHNCIPSNEEWIGGIEMRHKRKELREKLLSLKDSSSNHTPLTTSHTPSSSQTSPVPNL